MAKPVTITAQMAVNSNTEEANVVSRYAAMEAQFDAGKECRMFSA